MPSIEVENLTHIYSNSGETKALNNVNFKIESGSYVCLIGKTGSGKSTLAGNLGLILKPTSGQVLFDGVNVWENKLIENRTRQQIGFVFQFAHHQLFAETVEQDIAFGPTQMGLSSYEIKNRVQYAASLVNIDEKLFKKSPFELSGGQQKKVAIAGVLAMQPKILILDEPTVGIDPISKEKILKIFRNYHIQQNCTTIHITHNMQDVADCSNYVLIMLNGELVKFDLTEKIFNDVVFLKNLGFDVPQLVEVFYKLGERGFNIPTNFYNAKDAADFIVKKVLGDVKKN